MNWLVLLVLVVFTVTLLITLSLYLVWHYERQNYLDEQGLSGEEPPPALLMSIAAVAVEGVAIFILAMTTPLRLFFDFAPVKKKGDDIPVVLVHGYGGSSANLLWIRWKLKRAGHKNVYSFSVNPPTANARRLARQVANYIEQVREATGADKVDYIGHSMGGILIRYAITHYDLAGKVRQVVTLGSPHRGSRVANLLWPIGSAAQMRYDSPFFMELNQHTMTPGGDQGTRYCSIYSNFDNFVIPHASSYLSGEYAHNVHLIYHGHCALLYSPLVFRHIAAHLDPPDAAPVASPQ